MSSADIAGAYYHHYNALIDNLVRSGMPREQALTAAVGGQEEFGDIELVLLDTLGLMPGQYLIDVGCGSGRLTRRAARIAGLRYLGTDVVQELLDHARDTCGRPDFRFMHVNGLKIPEQDACADFVTFFSVGTHLLHEEFFLYLKEGCRVLKPGGKIVFSILDIETPYGQSVFRDNVQRAQVNRPMAHLNQFIGRGELSIWAKMLGMTVSCLIPGDAPVLTASAGIRPCLSRSVERVMFGQTVVVFQR